MSLFNTLNASIVNNKGVLLSDDVSYIAEQHKSSRVTGLSISRTFVRAVVSTEQWQCFSLEKMDDYHKRAEALLEPTAKKPLVNNLLLPQ